LPCANKGYLHVSCIGVCKLKTEACIGSKTFQCRGIIRCNRGLCGEEANYCAWHTLLARQLR